MNSNHHPQHDDDDAPEPRSSHFDDRAATWDVDPEHIHRATAIAREIVAAVPLTRSMRVLEYGAGTGLVSEALRERVGPVTLADTSQGMRDVLRTKIDSGVLADATVWDLDLSAEPPPPGEQFDLIVTVMTLHHVEDLAPLLAAFAELLAPRGHLCIADLEEEDGSFHGESFHGHRGFARPALAADLGAAGFTDPVFSVVYRVERGGTDYPVFLAVTTRRAAEPGSPES